MEYNIVKEILCLVGRLYIEKFERQALKLYITRIDNGDAGHYTCEGTIEGNHVERSIQLMLFSKYIS